MIVRTIACGIVAGAIALAAWNGPAAAQDALGTGNALDGNLRYDSGGWNAPTPRIDYRARNLLVTGDVPGGRGFRGSVGYVAAGDFSSRLGSDDTYSFRADSALSALPFVSSGVTAERLRFGQAMALNQISVRRESSQLAGDPYETPNVQENVYLQNRIRMDRFIQATSGSELIEVSSQPSVIGFATNRDGQALQVSSSGLRGLLTEPAARDERPVPGLSVFDRLRLEEDEQDGVETEPVGTPFQVRFGVPRDTALIEATPSGVRTEVDPISSRIAVVQEPEYDRILERIVKRYRDTDNVTFSLDQVLVKRLDDDYKDIRDRLIGATPKPAEEPGAEGRTADASKPQAPPRPPVAPGRRIDPGMPAAGGEVEPDTRDPGSARPFVPGERPVELDPKIDKENRKDPSEGLERFGIVLRHGERVDQLAGQGGGRFNELLRGAELRLRDGEYFWAERRFIRALRFVPGHPLATAGLGHAQLGAGLYGSATLTLRSLLAHQPEMIDVRYDDGLLPTRVRIFEAIEDLRTGPQQLEDRGHRGFLMAYLGHQVDDTALVREGLDLMTESNPSDPLVELLRGIWLDG